MMAINEPGIFLENRGVTIMSRILPIPTPSAIQFVVSKLWK